MKTFKLITWVVMALAITSGCNKDVNLKSDGFTSKVQKKGASEDFPYEIYEPQGEGEPYEQLEEGLINLFDENSTITNVGIAEAVWLWETGVNYMLYPDTVGGDNRDYLADSGYSIVRTVVLDVEQGTIDSEDLKSQIQMTYEDVEDALETSDDVVFACLDVQFIEEDPASITLKVVTNWYYFVTGYIGYQTVPPAVDDKYAGEPNICGDPIIRSGAWTDAKNNVMKTLPKRASATNIIEFSTGLVPSHKSINGDYLPGNSNSIYSYHNPPLSTLVCLYTGEQDSYAQALRNQLQAKMNNNQVFDIVQYLNVWSGRIVPAATCQWGFQVNLGSRVNGPLTRIDGSDLF